MSRILYFSRDYTTHDRRFLAALAETEHQVGFVRLERRGLNLDDRPLPPQIEQIAWAGGQEPFSRRRLPALLRDLQRVLRAFKPDLLHAGPLQTSALLAALSGFRPLVSMSWGSDLLIDADRSAWNRWATRTALRRSAVLVGDCDPVRQKAIAYGMADERIVTFPWGVDLQRFKPGPPPGAQAGRFHLLSTRTWEPLYGVEHIARAFAAVAPGRPELHLTMLGGGSQAGLLRQIFLQAGVLEQVSFPGQVSQAELPRYYQSADLYVAATHSDGASISLLEAMACARPVLVSDIPGNCEFVAPGANGWLFPDGDERALAEGILQAVEQSPHLAQVGANARQLAEQRADWARNFQGLLKAYELALKRS